MLGQSAERVASFAFAAPGFGGGRIDQGTHAIKRQGPQETLFDAIADGPQAHGVLGLLFTEFFHQFGGERFREVGDALLPTLRDLQQAFAAERLVSQH